MLASDLSGLRKLGRGELVLETGLTYDGITPVRVRIRKREGRFDFSDEGRAVSAAGLEPGRIAFDSEISLEGNSVNVSRRGVVSLPGFARSSDQWLEQLPGLVAEGSLALYDALLESRE